MASTNDRQKLTEAARQFMLHGLSLSKESNSRLYWMYREGRLHDATEFLQNAVERRQRSNMLWSKLETLMDTKQSRGIDSEDDAFVAGFDHVETMVPQADAHGDGVAFAWHGWALRDAFWAGVQWQRKKGGEQ